jgi:hypothetical protein
MNFAELETIWNSADNRPTAAEREKLTHHVLAWVRRHRRRDIIWLAWTFGVLTIMTSFAAWLLFATDKVNLAAEWAAVPLLLVPWWFAFLFLRRFLRPAGSHCRGDMPIADALAAALKTNEAAQFRLRAVGLLYAVFLPVLAVSMWQLHAVGKASSRELFSMAMFFGGVLLLSGAGVFARYRFRLKPQQQQLEELLRAYKSVND